MADHFYALVTGASSGIGAALARALARQGRRLVVTGRNLEQLEKLAAETRPAAGDVRIVLADLRAETGPDQIEEYLAREGLRVDLLVNNAGFGAGGDFAALPIARQLEMLDVNMRSLAELTHRHLVRMRERGAGAIINVASTAAFQAVPYMAAYAASKAFVLHLSLGLWEENRHTGVHVMALCPGTTRTGFFAVSGIAMDGPYIETPEQVAEAALRALARRRPILVCGWPNRAMVAVERLLPRRWVAMAAARYMRKRTMAALG